MANIFGLEAPLSKMAISNAHGEDSPYFAGWKAYNEDPYDAKKNPSGVIQMGLAENQVSFDLLENYLEEHPEAYSWSSGPSSFRENALFQDYHGLQSFRKAIAGFMEKIRSHRAKFDPERIVLTAGATAANELLTFILADPGDALLVPTPYYPGFDRDLQWRTRVSIVPIPCHSTNSFQLTLQSLETAYADAEASNLRVKALLITNPSNPLGISSPRTLLEDILDFISKKNIHLISDEIYSGSVFDATDFVSIAEIAEERSHISSEKIHIVYSLSKDLGLPGFRVGALYSYNDRVVKTARRMSSFSLVSSQTQKTLSFMLSDEEFSLKFIETNRMRLKERHSCVVKELRDSGIECLKGNAGLFCWVNLGEFLEKKNREEELKLWKVILDEVKLNISPGSSCHCSEAGWFRVCFANMSKETLEVALRRLREFSEKIRGRRRSPNGEICT
ncbi:1-aminocyclopropane-1-carboxylate synthase 7-like [Phalaenopsis equestris]|uniref:1-aminocyclopropane-1-carboxylate synthase 7-like n=1 Tax=Phalaenopsis equestris TaxID=78828 RepID=UPI0009E35C2B|nr:1-aminocyclopropane-1-carboxylate synthase 7-like [Phalaenopsis equestris]